MTVASLWKVLDEAGCGRNVGATQLANPNHQSAPAATTTTATTTNRALRGVNPWNYNNFQRQKSHEQQQLQKKGGAGTTTTTLAVDLSIWICESLTSHAMAEHHVNPCLHLVFSRTIKLLHLGVGLVFVVEGKRRIRDYQDPKQDDKFHKRRSGTAFWKACRDCQTMLELMGVPVVRAKAEGEALCALLSQRGIVDGVISNDGDCLLFGAKTVYTKFSLENLEQEQVMRYDLDQLRATIDARSEQDDDPNNASQATDGVFALSRRDLVAFAILTGSDLAGNGFDKVGYKKAIRFIRKCQLDHPLHKSTATMEELESWARAATAGNQCRPCQENPPDLQDVEDEADEQQRPKRQTFCPRCCHAGSKRSHEKHGCEICGTNPGEPCFEVTAEDRFRKSLRDKALKMEPRFDPAQIVAAYMRPNDNQLPVKLTTGDTCRTEKNSSGSHCQRVRMGVPNLKGLMQMQLIVKGRSLVGSREYVTQAAGRLLSRIELMRPSGERQKENERLQHQHGGRRQKSLPQERPVPIQIIKAMTQSRIPSYEVLWKVNGTVTDNDGNDMDGFQYNTIEPRDIIKQRYPALVQIYEEEAAAAEKERLKQGDGEQKRRRAFLRSLWIGARAEPAILQKLSPGGRGNRDSGEEQPAAEAQSPETTSTTSSPVRKLAKKGPSKLDKQRQKFFAEQMDRQQQARPSPIRVPRKGKNGAHCQSGAGDDVGQLLRFAARQTENAFHRLLPKGLDRMVPKLVVLRGIDDYSLESNKKDPYLKQSGKQLKRLQKKKRKRGTAPPLPPPLHAENSEEEEDEPLYCRMGDMWVQISPIRPARGGTFPPSHIYVHKYGVIV